MNKFKINKIIIMLFLVINIFTFSCSNASSESADLNKLEYLGYKYSNNKVSIFLKNYSKENYSVTLNSIASEKQILNDGIYELIFINNNQDSSLKIKNIINDEERVVSKFLPNPNNYRRVNVNQEFKIKINEAVFENSTNTILKLIDITEDSRCPDPSDDNENISNPGSCIHKPKTLLHLVIETAKYNIFDEFIYKEQVKDYEFFYGGNYIKISKIDPDIIELNRFIPDSDYEVTITISNQN